MDGNLANSSTSNKKLTLEARAAVVRTNDGNDGISHELSVDITRHPRRLRFEAVGQSRPSWANTDLGRTR